MRAISLCAALSCAALTLSGLTSGASAVAVALGDRSTATGAVLVPLPQPVGSNRLVSVRADGSAPDKESRVGDVSATGRYVTFLSQSRRLVAGTHCRGVVRWHVYVRDRNSGTTSQVDVRPDGRCSHRSAYPDEPSISADGRFVVFASGAHDLAPGGRRRYENVFLRDVVAGTTSVVDVAVNGRRANGMSVQPEISADGSTVVFRSWATNLTPGPPRKEEGHIYRRDLVTGTTTLITRTPAGDPAGSQSQNPSVSGDGMLVAYDSYAEDIVEGTGWNATTFSYDVATGVSTWLGRPYGDVIPDGGPSYRPKVSADGTTVVYESYAENLVVGDSNGLVDVFTYDVANGTNTRISTSRGGGSPNGGSEWPDIDADGTRISFSSAATNLVAGDDNGLGDIFVHDTSTQVTTLTSRTPAGAAASGQSGGAAIADDGSIVAYGSAAADIVPEVERARWRVYSFRIW